MRRSFPIPLTLSVLRIGIASASFHETGTTLSWIDALKISATGDESSMANSFKTKLGKLSGPEAFVRLRLESFVKTSSGEMWYFEIISLTTAGSVSTFSNWLFRGGRGFVIHRKLSLIFVANSVEWNSLPDTKTLDTGNFLGSPGSCLMDFHQEATLSQFFTLFAKKELLRLLFSLLTLFLNFL